MPEVGGKQFGYGAKGKKAAKKYAKKHGLKVKKKKNPGYYAEDTVERILSRLEEGKQKQADIKSDKELTRAGASSSSDPRSKRYSPSLHTMHNDPENIERRKARVKTSQVKRGRKKAWAWAQRTGHPSSTQSRMKKKLGSEAYGKLSSRPDDPSPVEAAKSRRKRR